MDIPKRIGPDRERREFWMDLLVLFLLAIAAMLIWFYHPERAPDAGNDGWAATSQVTQEVRRMPADRTIRIVAE